MKMKLEAEDKTFRIILIPENDLEKATIAALPKGFQAMSSTYGEGENLVIDVWAERSGTQMPREKEGDDGKS